MSLMLRTDVTAVKFHEDFILAGIGSSLNIFDNTTNKLFQRLLCLNGQKIYGLVTLKESSKLLVFGGKQFTVVIIDSQKSQDRIFKKLFEPVVCDDWLHSAIWLDNDSIAVLTAHNVVQKWNTRSHTEVSRHPSNDNSILYSGLLLPLQDGVLVFSGTVFSDVIIHVCGESKPFHRLQGHKGVIFSIACDLHTGTVVTTSDDRSLRVWEPDSQPYSVNSTDFWKHTTLSCKYELYGHCARVMRSCITGNSIVSVGEDSAICFWREGKLMKKFITHQNGCIWSVDSDDERLITGGGDGSVILHPLIMAGDNIHTGDNILDIKVQLPKKIMYTARKNIVILTENDELVHYNVEEKLTTVHKLEHKSTYKLITMSSCKQLIAVSDMTGKIDIFVENCKDTAFLTNLINTELQLGKILSMHWAGNRHLVLCTDSGEIVVLASSNNKIEEFTTFLLPNCKERWLTSAAIDGAKITFVFGDRCGNVHIYGLGQKPPLKTFPKVHGRYGPTSISIRNDELVTTGRDGTIKYFDMKHTKLLNSKALEFQWIEKFLDKDENLVCGFQERVFVVYNLKSNCKILEVPCGGGHRSWDAVRYYKKIKDIFEEVIQLVYLKNSDINTATFEMNKIVSKNIINGSHSKEINCLKTHSIDNDVTICLSGGEDTTIRISTIDNLNFEDQIISRHLSSVRTLKTCLTKDNSLYIFTAGGRAQICIKKIGITNINGEFKIKTEELIDYMVKGTDKERKGNTNWRNCVIDFNPETRIMDIDYVRDGDNCLIFCGCSDSILRIFTFNIISNKFQLLKEIKYHNTCILKTKCLTHLDRTIVITCTTRSEVALWETKDIIEEGTKPFFVTLTNKSGINSIDTRSIDDNLLIATGGDDNSIHLVLLDIQSIDNINGTNSIRVIHSVVYDRYHSSQITGLIVMDKYLISTGIDQRITLFKWEVIHGEIECSFVFQTYSDVADIQGIDLVNYNSCSITVCVFGKGMEIVQIPTST